MPPLHVAFLWHMHQPSYRNPATGVYELPWVRLRAAKDYVHMLEVLRDYPDVHVTINWTPVLLDQLEDYAEGRAQDRWLALAQQGRWSSADKSFMLTHFFSINWDRFVRRYPPYARLLALREAVGQDPTYLSDAYWQDLAVWFNLAWFDPQALQRDPALRALAEKGHGFDRDDLAVVVERQRRAAAAVLPLCRELVDRDQVELTTTPYHHPILPLLLDTASALEASPGLPLPAERTGWIADARAHVAAAIATHTARFGRPPRGLWPAEGALSQATLELLADGNGLAWVASDEGLLARALERPMVRDGYGHLVDPATLYQPYAAAGGRLAVFFRDVVLSDRIGFVYAGLDTATAVDDLIGRLVTAQQRLGADADAAIASIILDGENCWEHYPNNGDDFLRLLYRRLSSEPRLRTITFSGYLAAHKPQRVLPYLPAGSWIYANLETWIGEPAQNRAWDELARARARLLAADLPLEPPGRATGPWAALWAAEASDWFWWYCSRNQVGPEVLFDVLYREHFRAIYRGLRLEAPAWLDEPLTSLARRERARPPTGPVHPKLRAELRPGSEWQPAGWVEAEMSTGTMQRAAPILRTLRYGWSDDGLALRLEADPRLEQHRVVVQLGVPGSDDETLPLGVPSFGDAQTYALIAWQDASVCVLVRSRAGWTERANELAAVQRAGILECVLPRAMIYPPRGDRIELRVLIQRDGQTVETLPTAGAVVIALLPS